MNIQIANYIDYHNYINRQQPRCHQCFKPLIKVEHYEYDGVSEYGSYEPYWKCENGCSYPTESYDDLAEEEREELGRSRSIIL